MKHTIMKVQFALTLCTALMITISGCGGSSDGGTPRQPVYPVAGSIKLFGSPLPGATVAFAPQDGQPTAFGTTDEQGNFKLTTYDFQDGAAAGKFKVVVSKSANSAASAGNVATGDGSDHEAEAAAANSHDARNAKGGSVGLVPPQYSNSQDTPLAADVNSSGDNSFNFDLK